MVEDPAAFPDTLEAARRGERAALGRIYESLSPAVLAYLRGQGASEPEDLTSETFVGVVRGLARFRGDERAFRSWVFSIAHRRLIDERRRLSRRRDEPIDPGGLTEIRGWAPDAADQALERIGSERVARLLGSLTPDQGDVLLLRVIGGLSGPETAVVLGKTEGAVKALMRRALDALARKLETAKIA